MKQPNLLANPKRKFSAKQIAAQKRFAAMAKSGKFRKRKKNPVKAGAKRKPPKRNPRTDGFARGTKFHVTERTRAGEWKPVTRTFNNFDGAAHYAQANLYDLIKLQGGLDTQWGRKAYETLRDAIFAKEGATVKLKDYAELIFKIETPGGARYMESNPRQRKTKKRVCVTKKARKPRKAVLKVNPRSAFLIRAQRPVKSGYLYYYLRGDQFVKQAAHGDRFTQSSGESKMREILPKLPRAVASITLVKA